MSVFYIKRTPVEKVLKLFGLLINVICRAYTRHRITGDEPVDRFVTFLASIQFWLCHRYLPRLKKPRSISEKIFNRMLFDRNRIWTILSDKLTARDYVAKRVGADILVPLLWTGDKPEDIPFARLPTKFLIKTNHGCGYNIIIKDKAQIDQKKIVRQLRKWLNTNYCRDTWLGMEWAYKSILPKIIVEALLDEDGKAPIDYKFFCFSGRAEYLLMVFNRHENPYEKHFDRNFVPLHLSNGWRLYPNPIKRPEGYDRMVQVADSLAQGLDFIRVDLYFVANRIYFGEFTCYPAGGLAKFYPPKYDFIFGDKWIRVGIEKDSIT